MRYFRVNATADEVTGTVILTLPELGHEVISLHREVDGTQAITYVNGDYKNHPTVNAATAYVLQRGSFPVTEIAKECNRLHKQATSISG